MHRTESEKAAMYISATLSCPKSLLLLALWKTETQSSVQAL